MPATYLVALFAAAAIAGSVAAIVAAARRKHQPTQAEGPLFDTVVAPSADDLYGPGGELLGTVASLDADAAGFDRDTGMSGPVADNDVPCSPDRPASDDSWEIDDALFAAAFGQGPDTAPEVLAGPDRQGPLASWWVRRQIRKNMQATGKGVRERRVSGRRRSSRGPGLSDTAELTGAVAPAAEPDPAPQTDSYTPASTVAEPEQAATDVMPAAEVTADAGRRGNERYTQLMQRFIGMLREEGIDWTPDHDEDPDGLWILPGDETAGSSVSAPTNCVGDTTSPGSEAPAVLPHLEPAGDLDQTGAPAQVEDNGLLDLLFSPVSAPARNPLGGDASPLTGPPVEAHPAYDVAGVLEPTPGAHQEPAMPAAEPAAPASAPTVPIEGAGPAALPGTADVVEDPNDSEAPNDALPEVVLHDLLFGDDMPGVDAPPTAAGTPADAPAVEHSGSDTGAPGPNTDLDDVLPVLDETEPAEVVPHAADEMEGPAKLSWAERRRAARAEAATRKAAKAAQANAAKAAKAAEAAAAKEAEEAAAVEAKRASAEAKAASRAEQERRKAEKEVAARAKREADELKRAQERAEKEAAKAAARAEKEAAKVEAQRRKQQEAEAKKAAAAEARRRNLEKKARKLGVQTGRLDGVRVPKLTSNYTWDIESGDVAVVDTRTVDHEAFGLPEALPAPSPR